MNARKPYTAKAMQDHAHTYLWFKSALRWSVAAIILVLLALAIFVA